MMCSWKTAFELCYFFSRPNYAPQRMVLTLLSTANCQSCFCDINLFSFSYWQDFPSCCWKDWSLAWYKLWLHQLLQVFFWTGKCSWELLPDEFSLHLLYWGYMWNLVLLLNKPKKPLLVGNSITLHPILCREDCQQKQSVFTKPSFWCLSVF